jgi:hypothetical protein
MADTLSCLTSMPLEIVSLTHWYIYPGEALCKIKTFFSVFTAISVCLCLFVIAIDRYRKVCEPLGWQITPEIAKRLCCSIYLVAFLVSVPFLYFWGTMSYQYIYENRNITVTTCGKDTGKVHAVPYAITIDVIMYSTLFIMLVLYTLIARRLLAKRKPIIVGAKTLSHAKKLVCSSSEDGAVLQLKEYYSAQDASKYRFKDDRCRKVVNNQRVANGYENCKVDARIRRMTVIMLILTLSFIITAGVYLALLFLFALSDDNKVDKMSNGLKVVMSFFLRLYFINHVINPVVYISMDPHFRKTIRKRFYRIFSCKCC